MTCYFPLETGFRLDLLLLCLSLLLDAAVQLDVPSLPTTTTTGDNTHHESTHHQALDVVAALAPQ